MPIVLVLAGGMILFITQQNNTDSETQTTTNEQSIHNNSNQTYTMSDVSKHNSQDDCWLVIDGVVYDVTDFVNQHPGGNDIVEGCGQDATELFETRPTGSGTPHSSSARSLLPTYEIGTLE